MINIFNIIQCYKNKDEKSLSEFNKTVKKLGVSNIFNPSFYIEDDLKVFTFRAIKNGEKNISSFVLIKDGQNEKIINLSNEYSEKLRVKQLIDPKVLKLDNELYITFNSGWNPEGNSIFIMKIYPLIESPKCIIYNKRNEQERNWAFFYDDKEIYALYWLNPLKILRLKNENQDSWEFEDYYSKNKIARNTPKDLTIGTQLYKEKDKYYFVAHKKITILRKKVYFGKFCSFDFNNKKIKYSKKWLIHSFRSLLGSKIKHNTNLFSCTYFSGLQVFNDNVMLGYGINDTEEDFSEFKIKELVD